jgi:hypothetical protein
MWERPQQILTFYATAITEEFERSRGYKILSIALNLVTAAGLFVSTQVRFLWSWEIWLALLTTTFLLSVFVAVHRYHVRTIEGLNTRHKAEVDGLNTEREELSACHKIEIADLKSEHEKEIAALESQIDKLNEELRAFRVAAGKLKIDIQEHRIKRYVDLPDPTCDGSLITLKVVLLNRRATPLTIKDIRLDIKADGKTHTVYAGKGEIYEDRNVITAGALTYKGAKLDNLYLRGATSLTFAPGQAREGWLQFTLERILPTEIDGGKVTLIFTDTAGEEHPIEYAALPPP